MASLLQSMEGVKEALALATGFLPSFWTIIGITLVVMVCIPFAILWYARGQMLNSAQQLQQNGRKPRKFRKPKWNLDDPTAKRDTPMEMRGKDAIAAAVKRYADKQDTDSDSEEDPAALTPEQILAKHQEVPREPHVGIFLGVDDPMPSRDEQRNARCAADARDMSEAFGKLDYRTFALHDHKSHKSSNESGIAPTRLNFAHLLRTLKEGKYDEQTRKKPNTSEWVNCLVYLASRVRITSYGEGKSETLEFMLRQDREPDAVWIDMVELINKISDIPFHRLFIILDVVHTGEDDIKFEDGEDMPNPGKPCSMAEILKRTGVVSGIVNSQRCSVVGMTRPDAMPKEMPAELLLEGETRVKIRNGPFAHFFNAGLREVEKRDPNAEMWKSLSAKGLGGMGGGFGSMMPTVAPTTSGDLGICPFHCGDMTVDAVYRFLAKKVRVLLKNPVNDPAYHQGCVKMVMAMQKAIRPKDAPDTPAFMHEARREELMAKVAGIVRPSDERRPVTCCLHGDVAVGKTSLALANAWVKETLDYFSDGVYYVSLRDSLANLRAAGMDPLPEMQQRFAHHAAGYEGMLRTHDEGVVYLSRHFANLKAMVVVDDVCDAADVEALKEAFGLNACSKPLLTVLMTSNKKEVAEACDHGVEVPPVTDDEFRSVMAAAAGLLSADDLPKETASIPKSCGNKPLFASMIGYLMRGGDNAKWDALSNDLSKNDVVETIFAAMPETTSKCLRRLACIPTNRPVFISALMTFWQSEVGGLDWNKLYGVLAEVLDSGCMSLVLDEGYPSFVLLHPLVSTYLKKGLDGDADALLLDAYRTSAGMPEDCFKEEDVNAWIQVQWDGYFHSHAPEHMHKVAPHLVDKIFVDGRWLLSQHDSTKVDKLCADYKRYGTSAQVRRITEALEVAAPALRRHPWEVVPQLLSRLRGVEELNAFCADLTEGARAARPEDKFMLWLTPMFEADAFDPAPEDAVGSAATCVGFYKEYVVTGHEDGRVVLWSLRDGKKVRELVGHTAAVHGAVCTESGELATGSKDEEVGKRIRVWNLETGDAVVQGSLPKDVIKSETSAFNVKVLLGRTGTDVRDHDDESYGSYNKKNIVTDTVLVEHQDDVEEINCHTFVGWEAHPAAASMTLGCNIAEVKMRDVDGQLVVATGDAHGRMLLFKLMTHDAPRPADGDASDSD